MGESLGEALALREIHCEPDTEELNVVVKEVIEPEGGRLVVKGGVGKGVGRVLLE